MPDAPKVPQTAEEARALADKLDADAAIQEENAAKTRRSAAAWRAYARALEEGPAEKSDLRSRAQYDTNTNMNASAIARKAEPPIRARGRDITSESPIGSAATKLGITLKDLSKKLGYSYNTVRKWSSNGSVPLDVQQAIDTLLTGGAKRPGKSAK